MSAAAARCPHCGAVQSRAQAIVSKAQVVHPSAAAAPTARPVLKEVSSEEARALLAIADVQAGRVDDHDDEPGLFAALLFPHPRSAGPARTAELVLTVIAAPLIACSMIGAFFTWRSIRHADRAMERGLFPRLIAITSGIGVLSSIDLLTDLSSDVIWLLIGVCCLALLGRAAVRASVRSKRRAPDLTR